MKKRVLSLLLALALCLTLLPDARVGGGGRAGGQRHRAGGTGESSGCGIARHIGTGGGDRHGRSGRRGQLPWRTASRPPPERRPKAADS